MNKTIDRISGLPDEVLTHILSFMRTKKAVQTCILSKRWRNVWKSVPVLYFYLNEFWEKKGKWDDDGDGDGDGVGDEDEDEDEDEEWVISEHKFARFVDGVLDNRGPSHVDKVIYVWKYETHEAVLSPYDYDPSVEWLDRVVPLMPRVIIVYIERAYTLRLPDSVFSCASLEIFRMSLYSEDRAFVAPKSINLPSLKILELLCLELSDNFARKLFSGCPVLESATLGSCGLDISVISSDSLKKLDIEDCRQYRPLHISCPALVSLSIDNFYQGQSISLENLVSLVNVYIRILARDTDEYLPLPTLKLLSGLSNAMSIKLYIPCPELKKQLEMDIPDCKIFNNLKSLDIGRWDMINSTDLVVCFLKNSPNLQELTLQLISCQDDHEVPGQEGVGDDDLFQLEYLETLKIICARKERADKLVNLLGRYVKAIAYEVYGISTMATPATPKLQLLLPWGKKFVSLNFFWFLHKHIYIH